MAIKDADTNGAYKLVGHLLSPDFFDAAKFGTAKFAVTACEAMPAGDSTGTHKISGNLTLKDSTKNVSFPAKVTVADGTAALQAKFTVNRTDWDIKFGASEADPAEWMISKDIEIGIDVMAGKK